MAESDFLFAENNFPREKTSIFDKEWHPVAHVSELQKKGDYVARFIVREPVLVVKMSETEIVAFPNVCTHRASLLLEGAGNAPLIQCPYHKWTFGLDGELLAAPFMEGAEDFDPSGLCLQRLSAEIWNGFVFVNLDPEATPLAVRFPNLNARLEPLTLHNYVKAADIHFPSPWNWKVLMENFCESYHHFTVHPETLQRTWRGDLSEPVPYDEACMELRHSVDPERGSFTVFALFPTLMFVVSEPSGALLTWYDIQVRGVDYFDLNLKVFTRPDAIPDTDGVAELKALANAIHGEDIIACGQVQAGIQSRFARTGPLSPLEQPITRFHRYIRERLALGA